MRLRPILLNSLLLAALLAAIILPPVVSGLVAEQDARAAQQQGHWLMAARQYEIAAMRLPWRPWLWQEAGLAAFSGGQGDEAVRLLMQAEGRGALTLAGQTALGQALWETGRTEAALDVWQSALSASNPDPDLLRRLAEAYHALGDYAAEQDALRLLIDLRPQDAQVRYRLSLLLAADQPEVALAQLNMAARLDPRLDASVRPLRRALNLALEADEPAYRLTVAGQGLASVDEWMLARLAFARAVHLRPDYAAGWAWLGEANQHLGQDGAAALSRAEALDPESALVQVFLALHRQRQGHPGLAVDHLRRAVSLEPDNPVWQAALAEAYVQAGDLPPALEAYQQAIRSAPLDPQYWRRLAVFCADYQYRLDEIGLPAARQALELAPKDALSLDVMGQVYLALGNALRAEEYFQQALEADAALPEAHLHLAIVYLQTSRLELARPALLQVVDLAAGTPLGEQAQMLLNQYFP